MTKRMEWRGRGRQEQARASGRLCCVLWHVGCVLPGSVRAVDRPTHQIGFRKLDRQVPTNENQLSPSPSPSPSPGPSPKPSTANPSTYVPIQFNSPGHSAAVSSLPPFPARSLAPSLSIQSYPSASASASASRLPLTYVTLRHVRAKALLLHCHQTASPPIFSSPTFHSNKIDRTSTDIARPLSPSVFLLPSHHLGGLPCTLVINLHQFFHPHPSSTRITRAFTSIRIDPRHCFPPTRLGITSPNHPHYV